MRTKLVVPALASLCSLVNAKALLAVFPETVTIGRLYEVEWLVDQVEYLELLLVKRFPDNGGWSAECTLFKDVISTVPNGSYTWILDDSYSPGSGYGLWLHSTHIPDDGTGYADLTDWFNIVKEDDENLVQQELKAQIRVSDT